MQLVAIDSCCIIPWTTHDHSLYVLFTVTLGTEPHDSRGSVPMTHSAPSTQQRIIHKSAFAEKTIDAKKR